MAIRLRSIFRLLLEPGLVRDYLATQAERHRHKTFQEEYIEFLKRHDMEYDERYIWD